jgi:hypothetical protein
MAIEQIAYTTTLQDGCFEIRDYPERITAQITLNGDRKTTTRLGFNFLAAYIHGQNSLSQRVAMTAPVTQLAFGETITKKINAPTTQNRNTEAWTIQFAMPRKYTLETLPTPNSSRVHLVKLPRSRFASIRFSGLAHEQDILLNTELLKKFNIKHHIHSIGPASLAHYASPWTPWFMRRNEVLMPIGNQSAR